MQTMPAPGANPAEQIYGAGKGRNKLEYVAAALRAKGYYVDTDSVTDEIRAMIEAAVRELGSAEVKTQPTGEINTAAVGVHNKTPVDDAYSVGGIWDTNGKTPTAML
jgi:hypothetical protein